MDSSSAGAFDPVLARLDEIVSRARANRSRLGFFAAIYRHVTLGLRRALEAGAFEDEPRVARLGLTFAERYFTALDAFASGNPTAGSWRIAFATAAAGRLTILQDLLLGINAHINLDLSVAVADQAEDGQIDDFRNDFERVNKTITALLDPTEDVIDRFSPAIRLLDKLGGRTDETIGTFSVTAAREEAWVNAQLLAARPVEERPRIIAVVDRGASLVARGIAEPGFPFDHALQVARLAESQDVPAIIDALSNLRTA